MASTMRYERSWPIEDDGIAADIALRAGQLDATRVVEDPRCIQSLSCLIETEVIPRLMVAHGGAIHDTPSAAGRMPVDPDQVAAFAPLTMQSDTAELLAQVDAMLTRGCSVDTVMIDLLAPSARLLGEMWEDDRCDFVEVTMGLWRLQEIVHEVATRHPPERPHGARGRQVLFASMPGDQHNFGTVVIDEVFRRNGWLTERISEAETSDLLKRVAHGWYDLVGLTVSCDCHIATLPSVIAALRNVACNPSMCVMVGGRIFSANPGLAMEVGADGTARDARAALAVAMNLVRERAGELAVCN